MPWAPDFTQPFMLVDVSYTTFYKFYALKSWYMLAHKGDAEAEAIKANPAYKWTDNPAFMEKYKLLYIEQLIKISKKYKIPFTNIVFATDCRQSDIWRHQYMGEYKATRAESHRKQGFIDYSIFSITRELIAEFCNTNNTTVFSHPNAEADDVIFALTQFIKGKVPAPPQSLSPIYIIASDADYIQICSNDAPVVRLLNMKGDPIEFEDSKIHLINKILLGDSSDNIMACHITEKLRPPKASAKSSKLTKSLLKKLLDDVEFRMLILEQFDANRALFNEAIREKRRISKEQLTDQLTQDSGMSRNQLIIDFFGIPFDIIESVESSIMVELATR
jgi:hypothetical protein